MFLRASVRVERFRVSLTGRTYEGEKRKDRGPYC